MQECRQAPENEGNAFLADQSAAGADIAGASETKRRGSYIAGAAWGLFAISIWSGWFISSRFDVSGKLTAYDLVALRFGIAAAVLLPTAIRLRAGIGRLSWPTALALFAGSGALYSLTSTGGVTFAPAAEGAALTPGVMPMATAILSVLILKERVSRPQLIGFCMIFCGVFIIAGLGLVGGGHHAWIGHLLFIAGAFLFAGYTIALRRSGLSGMEGVAIVSLWSSITYLPVYFAALHPRIFSVPLTSLIVPAFYQAILTNIVSLIAYARAVSILGASRAAPFAALIPAMTAFLGILFLGEYPSAADWAGIACVSAGVYLASGAPAGWIFKHKAGSHSRLAP